MSGCLLADYEIGQRKRLKGLPDDGYLIKTIVTSNMADAIAEYYNAGLIECLTGFKYIGQQILGSRQKEKSYLFGFEGKLRMPDRNMQATKDAIVATWRCVKLPHITTKGMTFGMR